MPFVCVYPFVTNLALNLSIVPLALYFILNTHLQPMTVLSLGRRAASHA